MNSKQYKVNFNELPWEDPSPGMRVKTDEIEGKRIRFIELSKAFVDKEWCTKAHHGYILDGELEFNFNGNLVKYSAGDGLMIPGGEESKHKATAITDRVSIILIEEV